MTDFAAPQFRRVHAPQPPSGAALARTRDDWRLTLVILAFVAAFGVLAGSMAMMALTEPSEPQLSRAGTGERPVRGEITDRHGTLLAANLPGWSLYAHPRDITDPVGAAQDLARIFPDMTEAQLLRLMTSKSKFEWIKRPITPRQKQAVHDLGRPGLYFGARAIRIYPSGNAVSHILGGVTAETEDVNYAELVGFGGAERFMDARLRDPARLGEPLALSIDLGAQTALRDVLAAGVERMTAIGGAAVLLDVHTGEIVAMVSLPDFDPNERPGRFAGRPDLNPRFNRAAQGTYELGSTFKVLTAAFALETGVARADSLVETAGPMAYGRHRIRDMHRMPPEMTVTDIIVKSSNVGSARLAMRVGTPRFRDFMRKLGMLEISPVELSEVTRAKPLLPPNWTDLSTITISFGHGFAGSPLHLAAAYATVVNGGRRVRPTLMRGGNGLGEQVFSPETSAAITDMLRQVVVRGTGRRADVPGYEVGGKTGTADKARPEGGYYSDRVISTFAGVFPTSAPAYVLVVSLDEPTDRSGPQPNRQAGRTAAPVAGEAIRRIAPILGLRPMVAPPEPGNPLLSTGGIQ